jgi:hypothetical protein
MSYLNSVTARKPFLIRTRCINHERHFRRSHVRELNTRLVKSFFVIERLPVGADLNLGLLAVGDHPGFVRDDRAEFGN